MSCIPCQQANNGEEAKINKAEALGRQAAKGKEWKYITIVKQKNGAYTWKGAGEDLTGFEEVKSIYL